jgi:hypothetical protein
MCKINQEASGCTYNRFNESNMETPKYYNNENGTLYKLAEERHWPSYLFDIVKRLNRNGKKDDMKLEIEKSILVFRLWLEDMGSDRDFVDLVVDKMRKMRNPLMDSNFQLTFLCKKIIIMIEHSFSYIRLRKNIKNCIKILEQELKNIENGDTRSTIK